MHKSFSRKAYSSSFPHPLGQLCLYKRLLKFQNHFLNLKHWTENHSCIKHYSVIKHYWCGWKNNFCQVTQNTWKCTVAPLPFYKLKDVAEVSWERSHKFTAEKKHLPGFCLVLVLHLQPSNSLLILQATLEQGMEQGPAAGTGCQAEAAGAGTTLRMETAQRAGGTGSTLPSLSILCATFPIRHWHCSLFCLSTWMSLTDLFLV